MSASLPGLSACGPQVLQDFDVALLRSSKTAETVFSRLHGKYVEQSYRGNIFTACTQAETQFDLIGNVPPIALLNQNKSTRLLVPIRLDFVITTAPVGPVISAYAIGKATFGGGTIVVGNPVLTTFSGIVGQTASPMGQAVSGASMPLGVTNYRVVANHLTGASTTIPNMPGFFIEFDGTCLLAPGSLVCLGLTAADGTIGKGFCSLIWEEIPL